MSRLPWRAIEQRLLVRSIERASAP